MAFTTTTGSDGITSLVGTTGVDTATIVTLNTKTFVGANTGNDVLNVVLGGGTNNATDYNVRMGGGNDNLTFNDTILNSFISLDGETLANDGNDTFALAGGGGLIINSELVGRGGNDTFAATGAGNGLQLQNSTVNGNTGLDTIFVSASSSSYVYGGQNTDVITTEGNQVDMYYNGNKGADQITLGAFTFTGEVYGGQDADTLNASAVTNTGTGVTLSGDKGSDTITGSARADSLFGGEDSDAITGGLRADSITGGTGNDTFVYGTAGVALLTDSVLESATSNAGFDTINDSSWSTSATTNGDRLQVDVARAAIQAIGTRAGDASLGATLTNYFSNGAGAGSVNLSANGLGTITITGSNSFAGNYIVLGDGNADFQFAADAVIKVSSLTGIDGTNSFVVV